ncbi:outer envelope pore protein 16, chloroplastic isoform X2 [Phoenix dactylifera]|uniref:Outer envelope pore protein 16, chloroplastic isoform X2 n=1 Tax=Phoenix dactylifera TaxID=42345 RepID=A0A8B7BST7_PHODC|nr:outer envelope pore protein 16, chloroplastic isoform X2 [Phoenix dactylifera]
MPMSVFFSGFPSFPNIEVLNRTIEGFIKIGVVGASKVAVEETYDCLKKGKFSVEKLDDALRKVCRGGAYWGTTAGAYVGMEYGMERIRGTRDWNAMLGGAITGALISAAHGHGRDQVIANAITIGALATAAKLINNLDYESDDGDELDDWAEGRPHFPLVSFP